MGNSFGKIFLILVVLAMITSMSIAAENDACVFFFTGDGCPHCAIVDEYLVELEENHPNLDVKTFEVWYNASNAQLLDNFYDLHEVPRNQRGVPVMFVGDEMLVGDVNIEADLESKIQQPIACPEIPQINQTSSLSLPLIIGAGLVDSINPCAIAVILILLTSILIYSKKKAFIAGFTFTAAIYISYFLFGIALFTVLQSLSTQISFIGSMMRTFIAIFAIVIGLWNIKDGIWYGAGGFVMEIPRKWRPKMKKLIETATSPLSAFIIGFAVSLFELPCTGGPYFFVTGYLADFGLTLAQTIPYLLLYNIFFVLPLIIINAVIFLGYVKIEKVKTWRMSNIKSLHLVAGAIMLALGLGLLLGFF